MEPAGTDVGVVEPVDSLFVIFGSENGSFGKEVVSAEDNFFGTTDVSEPFANDGNFEVFFGENFGA